MLPSILCLLLLPAINAGAWKQREFVISFWWPPPPAETTLERYREIADAGFNLVLGGNGVSGAAESMKMLDLCRQVRLRAIVVDPRVEGGKADGAGSVVADYGKHPALEGYHLVDEPSAAAFPALRDTVAALRKADPRRLAYINLFPTYATPGQLGNPTYEDHVRQYLETVKPDLLSFDHYPYLTSGERADYLENLEIIRRQALEHKTPFWAIVQAEGIEGAYRSPGEVEMRQQVFTALAYGAKGIVYFTYWTPDPGGVEKHFDGIIAHGGLKRARYEWVKTLNAQLKLWGKVLMPLRSRGVYHSGTLPAGTKPVPRDEIFWKVEGGPATIGVFEGAKGKRFLLVVNREVTRSISLRMQFNEDRVRLMVEHSPSGKVSENLIRTDLKFPARYDAGLRAGEARLFEIPGLLRK